MSDLMLNLLEQDEGYVMMMDNIERGLKQQLYGGLREEILPFVVVGLRERLGRPVLVVTADQQKSQSFQEILAHQYNDVYSFPDEEILPHERLISDLTLRRQRLEILESLIGGGHPLIFISISALLRTLLPPSTFFKRAISLEVGDYVDTEDLLTELISSGYQREAMVETPGEISIRGGVMDIFPLSCKDPIRLELFGDEIESIRSFDQGTQRSQRDLTSIIISPAREDLIPRDVEEKTWRTIEREGELTYGRLIKAGLKEEASFLENRISEDVERLREGVPFAGGAQYLPYFYTMEPLFSYLSKGIFAIYHPGQILKRAEGLFRELLEIQVGLMEQGSVLPRYENNFLTMDRLRSFVQQEAHLLFTHDEEIRWDSISHHSSIETRGVEPFHGQLDLFKEALKGDLKKNYRVLLAMDGERKARRLIEYLEDEDFSVDRSLENLPPKKKIWVVVQPLDRGFALPGVKTIIYTHKEIFGQKTRKKRRLRGLDGGVRLKTFEELQVGDYVVHENHGIGKYLGINTLNVQDLSQDYLVIKYSGADRLYVPTNQIDSIQKYIGTGEVSPRLNKLGGHEWARAKRKVKESVEKMAEDLIELYAEREVNTGFSFSPDTVWQQEFEEEFPFEETPDQIQATEEIKKDMESERPMDRLLCGDVGYGKTEVAIRAAFKAVMDQKQVAVLVPTTILAQQHYNTFRDRFHNYPIKVEVLSRFRSKKEQRETLKDLSRGRVDVIIATHRLLSKDVKFYDLGLLIVDEEQRFGVSHKERLKEMKKSVDVLTLTATPIPRTLHMSLVKVRDMSIIETPPEDRYPIRTYVREYNEELIKNSIERELSRGGQVYYVHNRVENIEKVASKLKKLVPEARVGISHGQMGERELEEIMLRFLVGDYDVLVCTTIIENGLDIANVNTMIVNNADYMGLAQLYQLRGRVGRSNRVAYAYLLYRTNRILGEDAEKRLRAIKEFSSLGSGFKLAMRDLEIRGAGNLLGVEQHGHIAAIGFSLYCRLLEEAVQSLKGVKPEKKEEMEIEMEVNAYIPDTYIPDSRNKIEIYKKVSRIIEKEDLMEMTEELKDRFGEMPSPVDNLIRLAYLKCWAKEMGIRKMVEKNKRLTLSFHETSQITGETLVELSRKFNRRIRFKAAKEPEIVLNLAQYNRDEKIEPIYELLESIESLQKAVMA